MIKHLDTSKQFHQAIETIALGNHGNYFEAVIEYITKCEIEVETVASYIKRSPSLKAKLEAECFSLNLLQTSTSAVDMEVEAEEAPT